MKIKVGDTVKVNIGRDKGKTGKVTKVLTKDSSVLVEGLNLYKRHTPKRVGGGIVEKIFPIHSSKVNLVCPKCSQPTRVGMVIGSDSKKVRVCRKCKQVIE